MITDECEIDYPFFCNCFFRNWYAFCTALTKTYGIKIVNLSTVQSNVVLCLKSCLFCLGNQYCSILGFSRDVVKIQSPQLPLEN